MQSLLIIANTLSSMDIQEELTMFLCSVIAFFVLMSFRSRHFKVCGKSGKIPAVNAVEIRQHPTAECKTEARNDAHYIQADKALLIAVQDEDYSQVLTHWNELKHNQQSAIHLPVIITAMRACNKAPYLIMKELRDFFKANPKVRSIGLVNDLLEPLARSLEDAHLVDLIVRMIPSIKLVKDSRTYEILLTMHAANGKIPQAQEIMAEMKAQDIVFTPRATVAVMNMGLKMGNIDVVFRAVAKLKPSWDVRSTWAVSMFAVARHKTATLMQIVNLACEKHKLCGLSEAFEGMVLPEEVIDVLRGKVSLLNDVDLATTIAMLEKSGRNLKADVIYNTFVACLNSRSKMRCVPWKARQADSADSSASTSEGSRSDSEEESIDAACFGPPPGLAPPPGF